MIFRRDDKGELIRFFHPSLWTNSVRIDSVKIIDTNKIANVLAYVSSNSERYRLSSLQKGAYGLVFKNQRKNSFIGGRSVERFDNRFGRYSGKYCTNGGIVFMAGEFENMMLYELSWRFAGMGMFPDFEYFSDYIKCKNFQTSYSVGFANCLVQAGLLANLEEAARWVKWRACQFLNLRLKELGFIYYLNKKLGRNLTYLWDAKLVQRGIGIVIVDGSDVRCRLSIVVGSGKGESRVTFIETKDYLKVTIHDYDDFNSSTGAIDLVPVESPAIEGVVGQIADRIFSGVFK